MQDDRTRSLSGPPDGPDMRLLVGDCHRAFAEALAMRLDAEPGMRVVAAVARPHDVLRIVRTQPVDIAVLAADTDVVEFVSVGATLLAARPALRLVAVSGGADTAALTRAVRAGFRAWVPKEAGVAALLDVLRAVQRGETCIPPALLTGLLDQLLREVDERRAAEAPLGVLTTRELQVLGAIASGASRREIANRLSISENTVRTHTQGIFRKLDVHTSLAAAALARRAGLGSGGDRAPAPDAAVTRAEHR